MVAEVLTFVGIWSGTSRDILIRRSLIALEITLCKNLLFGLMIVWAIFQSKRCEIWNQLCVIHTWQSLSLSQSPWQLPRGKASLGQPLFPLYVSAGSPCTATTTEEVRKRYGRDQNNLMSCRFLFITDLMSDYNLMIRYVATIILCSMQSNDFLCVIVFFSFIFLRTKQIGSFFISRVALRSAFRATMLKMRYNSIRKSLKVRTLLSPMEFYSISVS